MVAPFDYLFKNRGRYEQTYEEEVERCAAVKQRVSSGRRVTGYFATKDYSYRATHVAGDGWVMIGDAWGFLDPLYSSGVLLALKSGELAADAIVEGPEIRRHVGGSSSASGGRCSTQGVDRMRRLVCEYYDGFSFGAFRPQLSGAAGHGHRPADRRSVHRSRRQGVAADGVALSAGQGADSAMERRHAAGRRAREGERAHAAGRTKAIAELVIW